MNNLISQLKSLSSMSRLNTVEAAYSGSAGAQANFKATWQGYNEAGDALVKINGKLYPANSIGITGLAINSPVTMRVGKGIKTITW